MTLNNYVGGNKCKMINILLEAFIAKYKKTKTCINKYLIIMILTLISFIVFMILYFIKHEIIFVIISLISFVFSTIDIAAWEKYNYNQFQFKYEEHNEQLNAIKSILMEFKYNGNNNWYSKDKIKYLIHSGELYIEEHQQNNTKLLDLCKNSIIPIVAFVAGIISDNSTISDALAYGVVTIGFLIFLYSVVKIISFSTDLIFRSTSINEMKYLIFMLNELLLRDFK